MGTRGVRFAGAATLLVLWTSQIAAAAPSAVSAAPPPAPSPARAQPPITVFAAASLGDALDEVNRAFSARTGITVQASFAASSVLAKQIEAGAPAEVFFSADHEWVDYLDQRALLKPGTRRDLLGNSLVLVAPADSAVRLKIAPGFDLAGALAGGRLATADPDSVPAGRYARAALTRLGVWDEVSAHLARAENVRTALAYVARGEAPLGIVYRTDAQAEKRVRIVDGFPADPAIAYPLALTASARPQALQYAEFLASEAAREIFLRYGFSARLTTAALPAHP
jgi:molybdate transport system substrate-binding protein